eukprot:CAMPEP_0119398022 /NCGR_PEP_ID=MMETSP1334-20130426/140630_1 /TAXON_ID=127549 /ORGANISM="Calcidiscus leptoporus, Strain RCC1130" /LENGTH=210 /DNA_ID=CAMNT_0007421873 /DNA_START=592 /DNA_END=1224 /DNA_ORIENTATION=+
MWAKVVKACANTLVKGGTKVCSVDALRRVGAGDLVRYFVSESDQARECAKCLAPPDSAQEWMWNLIREGAVQRFDNGELKDGCEPSCKNPWPTTCYRKRSDVLTDQVRSGVAMPGGSDPAVSPDPAVYFGNEMKTSTGSDCADWNRHLLTWWGNLKFPTRISVELSTHNYCRDPDGYGQPWCYRSGAPGDLFGEWDVCNIPKCNEDTQTQ